MAFTAYCHSCQRTVYVADDQESRCPVCASPLADDREAYVPEAAAERIVRNEALFRDLNELVAGRNPHPEIRDKIAFVCECGQQSCIADIHLTSEEYAEIRSTPVTFVTVLGHEVPGVEVVRERRESYQIVEKVGPPRRIAEEEAPRGESR